MTVELDLKSIKNTYSTEANIAVWDNLAAQGGNPPSLELNQAMSYVLRTTGTTVSRGELVDLFHKLAFYGAGEMTSLNERVPTEFKWSVNPVLLARYVTGEREIYAA